MEVNFTPEQQERLARIAAGSGLLRSFLAAVEKGITAAEHGELIEEEEMDARFESMLKD